VQHQHVDHADRHRHILELTCGFNGIIDTRTAVCHPWACEHGGSNFVRSLYQKPKVVRLSNHFLKNVPWFVGYRPTLRTSQGATLSLAASLSTTRSRSQQGVGWFHW